MTAAPPGAEPSAQPRSPDGPAAHEPSPALRALTAWAGRIVGCALGLAAGAFGAAAGFTLGFMVDEARVEAGRRRRMRAYLSNPDLERLDEPLPGLTAAAAVALVGAWPEPATPDAPSARESFESRCRQMLALDRADWRWLGSLLDAMPSAPEAATEAQARRLALRGCPAARRLLGDFAYARLALSRSRFDPDAERAVRVSLANCGLDAATLAESRSSAFPAARDPWALLELAPGSSALEVRRAYRRLSRRCHPDAVAAGADAEEAAARFRELQAAYEELRGGAEGRA